MAFTIPQRIGWAVATVAAEGPDSLLEIGCGRGLAVALIAPRLTTGRILAIDRSAVAIAAAKERNSQWEVSGKAGFVHAAVSDLDECEDRFDKIFAINVNQFWTDPGTELPAIRKLLKDEGRLYLFYEPPQAGQRKAIAEKITAGLSGSGLVVQETAMKVVKATPLLCVIAGPGKDQSRR